MAWFCPISMTALDGVFNMPGKQIAKCLAPNCNNLNKRKHNLCSKHLYRKRKFNSFDLPKDSIERISQKNLPEGIIYRCRIHGDLTKEFTVNKSGTGGHWCKHCRRDYQIRFNYKINSIEYEKMLKEQDYKCFICKKHEISKDKKTNKVKKLSIDHCHKTGKVRKLLCGKCNQLIGLGNESIQLFQNIIKYLSFSWS